MRDLSRGLDGCPEPGGTGRAGVRQAFRAARSGSSAPGGARVVAGRGPAPATVPAQVVPGRGLPAGGAPRFGHGARLPAAAAGRERTPPAVTGRAAPWQRGYTRAVVATDLGVCLLAVGAAQGQLGGRPDPRWPLLGGMLVLALAVARVYEHRFQDSGGEEFRRLLLAGGMVLAASSTLAYALQAGAARGAVVLGLPLALGGSLLVHLSARAVLRAARRRGHFRHRVLAIGLERSVAELVRATHRDTSAGVEIVAACVSRSASATIEGVPVHAGPAEALRVLALSGADTVILTAWSDVGSEQLRRLSWDLEGSGIQLLVAPRLAEVAVPRLHIRTVGGLPLLDVDEPEFTGMRRVVKTGLDYTLAVVGLLLLAPVMLAVAVAVRLGSRGPVLFRQERIGQHGKPFVMHKFRSMYVDAEQRRAELEHLNEHAGGPLFKIRDDPRVTPVGAVIRRYSLDELPQLFDVLLGRMSLVGPRPPLRQEVAGYDSDARRRLLVKPGITGLWQVSGRSDLSWEESVRLDLHYVENWFLGLDLSIIGRTLAAVLARSGAY